ncbi:MAG: addiction module antidote protein [Blastocatellia bacterium]
MTKPSTDYKEFLHEQLQDPEEAALYINAMLEDEEDEDGALLMLALRDVAEAYGVARVAARSKLNRESLYKLLSKRGNPRLSSLSALLKAVGLKLVVEIDRAKVIVESAAPLMEFSLEGTYFEGTYKANVVDFSTYAHSRRNGITIKVSEVAQAVDKESKYAADAIAA